MNNLLLQANRSYFVLLSHILRPHNSANYSKQQKNLDLSVKNYLNPFKCRITYSNSRLARVSNILGCNVTSLLPSKSLKQEGNNQIIKVAFSMTCLFRGISKSQRAPLYVGWISKVFIVSCYRL